jgi:hypothetical protein
MGMSHHINMIGTPRYRINASEFYWEIVDPDGLVEDFIWKHPENRNKAVKLCRRLNSKLPTFPRKVNGNVATATPPKRGQYEQV